MVDLEPLVREITRLNKRIEKLETKEPQKPLKINVLTRGVKGDAETDDTAKLQALLSAPGASILFPKPPVAYKLTDKLTVPDNAHIEFEPGTLFELEAGASHAVFDLDGVSNVHIEGKALFTKAAGANVSGSAYAVYIRGECTDVVVQGITSDALLNAVRISGDQGTTPGTCRRITLRDVIGRNSPSSYGINIAECDVITIDNCYGLLNWLDGLKLRQDTRNVLILGGEYGLNGTGYTGLPDSGPAGDGADCFAGGDQFTIIGTHFIDNNGHGLTVKTDSLNRDSPATYGYVRNVQLTNITATGNLGSGCGVYTYPQADTTIPHISHVVVTGGYFGENDTYGLYLDGRNIEALGPICRKNGDHGILVDSNALYVELHGAISVGNDQNNGGSAGLSIIGKHIQVIGGIYIGSEADIIRTEADLAALTPTHNRNIAVNAAAADVLIRDVMEDYNSNSQGIHVAMTSGVCITHQRGAGDPAVVGVYGSVGSTWTRTDGTAGSIFYMKTSGAPNAPTIGWVAIA